MLPALNPSRRCYGNIDGISAHNVPLVWDSFKPLVMIVITILLHSTPSSKNVMIAQVHSTPSPCPVSSQRSAGRHNCRTPCTPIFAGGLALWDHSRCRVPESGRAPLAADAASPAAFFTSPASGALLNRPPRKPLSGAASPTLSAASLAPEATWPGLGAAGRAVYGRQCNSN